MEELLPGRKAVIRRKNDTRIIRKRRFIRKDGEGKRKEDEETTQKRTREESRELRRSQRKKKVPVSYKE